MVNKQIQYTHKVIFQEKCSHVVIPKSAPLIKIAWSLEKDFKQFSLKVKRIFLHVKSFLRKLNCRYCHTPMKSSRKAAVIYSKWKTSSFDQFKKRLIVVFISIPHVFITRGVNTTTLFSEKERLIILWLLSNYIASGYWSAVFSFSKNELHHCTFY